MTHFPLKTQVGPFSLDGQLSGEGNMAWVYRACLRRDPQRYIVLKIARADGHYEQIFEQLLRNEVRILTDFRHPGLPHVYPIHAYGRIFYVGRAEYLAAYCNGVAPWYFAMELLSGGTLESHLPLLRTFPLEWKLELLYQVAIILDYLHLRGLAHLDLKPGNILFRQSPRPEFVPQPVLIDFGIAERNTLPQEIRAVTMMYAAPERVMDATGLQSPQLITTTQEVNHTAADIWAFGVLAYELLTGQYPFRVGKSKDELARSILSDAPAPIGNGELGPELEAVLRYLLAKPREQRPTIHQVIAMLETRLPIYPPRLPLR
jgi:serine/threonine protein kinase